MVLDILYNFVVSLASMLWGSLLYSIPVFCAVIIGRRVHAFFSKQNVQSWVLRAFLASYVIVFALLILAFFVPVWQATTDSAIGIIPEDIRLSPLEFFTQFFFGLVKVALISALVSVLLLPFIFLGAFVREQVQERIQNLWLTLFIAVFVSVFVAWLVLLFLVPWVIPGLVYLFYWG